MGGFVGQTKVEGIVIVLGDDRTVNQDGGRVQRERWTESDDVLKVEVCRLGNINDVRVK